MRKELYVINSIFKLPFLHVIDLLFIYTENSRCQTFLNLHDIRSEVSEENQIICYNQFDFSVPNFLVRAGTIVCFEPCSCRNIL